MFAKPAQYFPIERGVYEVTPGLRPLGFDFGNNEQDQKIFQLDSDFQRFKENKILCRQERLSKYFCIDDLSSSEQQILTAFLAGKLVEESPQHFQLSRLSPHETQLVGPTGDQLIFDSQWNLKEFVSSTSLGPEVTNSLDALSLQVQEDLCLVKKNSERGDWLSFLHLCSPSHWAAEDKIGQSFVQVHSPIPHIEKINRVADHIVEAMIHKGPFVRFVWSFVTDDRLNHHPIAPPGWDSAQWRGRSFEPLQGEPFYFRVERQVIYGLPQISASLFTIRISFIRGTELRKNAAQKNALVSALRSMSPESRKYKGVENCFDELIQWMEKSN